MKWKQIKRWNEQRRLQKELVSLPLEKFKRDGVLPAELDSDGRLSFRSEFLRSGIWAQKHVRESVKTTTQGSFKLLTQESDEDSFCYQLGRVLGLTLKCLTFDSEELHFQFFSHEEDNCQEDIILSLDLDTQEIVRSRVSSSPEKKRTK